MKVKSNKITWIELLRVVSIFVVVLTHSASHFVKNSNVNSVHWAISSLYFLIGVWGLCCFVMISGALLLSSAKSDDLSVIFKRIRRIALIFIIWSAIYTIESAGKSLYAGQGLNIKRTIYSFITGGRVHLWYLYMLVGLYLVTPLLRAIVKNKKLCLYFIILCLVFSYTPNMLMATAPAVYEKYLYFMNEKLHLHMVIGYTGYYVTGFYISNYGLSDKHTKLLYIAGVIGAIFTAAGTILHVRAAGEYFKVYIWMTTNMFVTSAAIFTAFKNAGKTSKFMADHKVGITYLGSCTFGIYLIHLLIMDIGISRFIESLPPSYSIFTIPLEACAIFGLSLLAVSIIKKIPVINKIV